MAAIDTPKTATRRELLASAAAIGTLPAMGSTAVALFGADAARAAQAPMSEADLLGEMLSAEFLAVAVYEGVIASGLLSPYTAHEAHRALSQERAHVRALTPTLLTLGGTIPPRPGSPDAVDAALAARHVAGRLADLHTEHDCVALLLDLESVVIGVYYLAMPMIQDPGVVQLAAQIMANEAQHATAVSEARRPGDIGQAVPYAFVEGTH